MTASQIRLFDSPEDEEGHGDGEQEVNDAEFVFQEHTEEGKEAEDEEEGGVGEGFHGMALIISSATCGTMALPSARRRCARWGIP